MSDPRRFLDGDDFASSLLRSAENDAPSASARHRAALAIGVGGLAAAGVAVAAPAAAGAAAKLAVKSTWLGASLLKWTVAGVLVVGAGGGTAYLRAHDAFDREKIARDATPALASVAPTSARTAWESDAPERPLPVAPSPPIVARELVRAPRPLPAPTASSALITSTAPIVSSARTENAEAASKSPGPVDTSLAEEVASLDRARHAVAEGDAKKAFAELDGYDALHPSGVLAPEAKVLRVELLTHEGRSAEAREVGNAFLARSPNAPEARRVRSILAGLDKP